jgi:pyrroloquinoline quinone biosynthesis protein D
VNKGTATEEVRPVLARGVRLQHDAQTRERVLLLPEGVIYLNATAQEIVTHCNGQSTAAAIISLLAEEYDVDRETLRSDVLECLSDLHQRKVLEFI